MNRYIITVIAVFISQLLTCDYASIIILQNACARALALNLTRAVKKMPTQHFIQLELVSVEKPSVLKAQRWSLFLETCTGWINARSV